MHLNPSPQTGHKKRPTINHKHQVLKLADQFNFLVTWNTIHFKHHSKSDHEHPWTTWRSFFHIIFTEHFWDDSHNPIPIYDVSAEMVKTWTQTNPLRCHQARCGWETPEFNELNVAVGFNRNRKNHRTIERLLEDCRAGHVWWHWREILPFTSQLYPLILAYIPTK